MIFRKKMNNPAEKPQKFKEIKHFPISKELISVKEELKSENDKDLQSKFASKIEQKSNEYETTSFKEIKWKGEVNIENLKM